MRPRLRPENVNGLIERLPHAERIVLKAHTEQVDIAYGDSLATARKIATHVYFPLNCILSLIATVGGHPPLQMRMIGCEGMLGVTLALGVRTSPLSASAIVPGSALRMPVSQFLKTLDLCPTLRKTLHHYMYVLWAQLAQTLACTHFHVLEQRLALNLLTVQDRLRSDQFSITHEMLANMLGVRRSGVTCAAHVLQANSLICYRRGNVTILDRPGLEKASCECFMKSRDIYTRQLGRRKATAGSSNSSASTASGKSVRNAAPIPQNVPDK